MFWDALSRDALRQARQWNDFRPSDISTSVSASPPYVNAQCKRCSEGLAPGALVCERCHTLVHSEELERLAAEAKTLEAKNELLQARQIWLRGLPLLPAHSTQAEWIQSHAQKLLKAANSPETQQTENKWVRKLGPLGPIALLLAKGKSLLALFKLNFLLSLVAFMGFYWAAYGAKFGIGFAVLVLIHEMGHFIDIKRRGLPADMPVFLPGLGAYVRWKALGVSQQTRAAISLAGPLAGWLAAAVCLLLWWKTRNGLWAALARASAWLNVLNLIPVWMLDGGQAVLALGKAERLMILMSALVLWVVFHENVFILVALGAAWRLFTKDAPPQPDWAIAAYFVAVLASLALVMSMVPGQGFGA